MSEFVVDTTPKTATQKAPVSSLTLLNDKNSLVPYLALSISLLGACIVLSAPFVSCHVGGQMNEDAIITWSRCLTTNTELSLSRVFALSTGAAMSATGLSLFYPPYILTIEHWIAKMKEANTLLKTLTRIFVILELLGMVLCMSSPMVTDTMKSIHRTAFCIWIPCGCIACILLCIVVYQGSREKLDKLAFLCVRATVLSVLGIVTLIFNFVRIEEFLPMFRLLEFVFLLCQLVFGCVLIKFRLF